MLCYVCIYIKQEAQWAVMCTTNNILNMNNKVVHEKNFYIHKQLKSPGPSDDPC